MEEEEELVELAEEELPEPVRLPVEKPDAAEISEPVAVAEVDEAEVEAVPRVVVLP